LQQCHPAAPNKAKAAKTDSFGENRTPCRVVSSTRLRRVAASITRAAMIVSFKHKALERFSESGDARGLNPDHLKRLRAILTALEAARTIEGVNVAGFHLHPLKGDDREGQWAVTVRANWRITFRFEEGKAFNVNLEDYH
jgi:toxin HigB-1